MNNIMLPVLVIVAAALTGESVKRLGLVYMAMQAPDLTREKLAPVFNALRDGAVYVMFAAALWAWFFGRVIGTTCTP